MKKKAILFSLLLLLSAFSGFAYDAGHSGLSLTGVSDMLYGEEYLYVIDNDGITYDFLKLTKSGVIVSEISVPKLSGSWWNAYTHLTEDSDGTVYVHQYKTSMEKTETEAAVYRCNFAQERLDAVWQLEDQKAIECQVKGEKLYYAGPDEKGGTLFFERALTGEERIIYETEVPYGHLVSAYYDEAAGIFWSDYNGRLYKNGREIDGAEGAGYDDRAHIVISEGRIVYTDTKKQSVESVDFITEERKQLLLTSEIKPGHSGLEYKDMIPLYYGENTWCAALDVTGNRRTGAVFDYSGNPLLLLSEVSYTPEIRWSKGFGAAVLVFFGVFSLYKAAALYLRLSKGVVSIMAKLFLILAPVLLTGGLLLAVKMLKTYTDYSTRSAYDLLYALADVRLSRINPEDLLALKLSEIPEEKGYQRIFGGKDFSVLPNYLYDEKGSQEPVVIKSYQWVYLKEEGVLKYAVVDDSYYGARVDYYRDREQIKLMEDAMKSGHAVRTRYNDQEGNWLALYVPILDDNGAGIGIMESGMSMGNLQYMSRQQTKKIEGSMAVFLGVLTVILSCVLRLSLYPLSRLRHAVEELAGGNYEISVPVKSKDEVAGISAAFNRMAQEIRGQISYIEACINGYEKFVPQKIFKILERENITKLELGDHRELTASVMAANNSAFPEIARNMNAETIYTVINHMLRNMLPVISGSGGIVDHMLDAGVLAYFPGDAEDALRAAVEIREGMNRHSGEESAPPFGIGIARGTVRIGIVGQDKRAAIKTLSESVTLSGYLSDLAQKYGAGIIITGTAARQIEDFERKYHVRMIGYLRLDAGNSVELLYDAYDGEKPELFRKREETKAMFEAGMEAFVKESYYEARQKFAQVLRCDRNDLAARAYVYRCDTYYQMEDRAQTELYLEHY